MSWWYAGVLVLPLVAVLRWGRRNLVRVTVRGRSMQPTYADGHLLLVRRVPPRRLAAGRVVVLERPDEPDGLGWSAPPCAGGAVGGRSWLVKRLAAVPGDPVPPGVAGAGDVGTVPAGRVVVLGDNAAASMDSREIGLVPVERVLGVALRSRRPAAERGPARG
ncbi:S26 family signal peptidase [Catellatospora sp. NPDC049609]|uniref:S26 family signal peptidase n=1 Tax=Catellatospora sp. NPDC049609 TaxID=3155505 RepID=UPI00342210B3